MENIKVVRYFTFLLLFLFAISFVSAADWDNVAKFEDGYGKYGAYEIKNSFLGFDWLGYGKVIDLVLKKNTDECYEDCYAEKQIDLYITGSLVDEVRFLRGGKSGVETNIEEYHLYYQYGSSIETIDDYEKQCSLGKYNLLNDSYDMNCEDVLVGSHIQVSPRWVEFNEGDSFSPGSYNVKLVGKKNKNWIVDWQIRTNGIWTTEWAEWQPISVDTTGLARYYTLNESSGPVIDSTLVADASNNGASPSATGKIGDAYNGWGEIIVGQGNANITGNITVSAWIFPTSTPAGALMIIARDCGVSADCVQFRLARAQDRAIFVVSNTGGTQFTADTSGVTTLEPNNWYHVTGMFNGTDVSIFVNGTLYDSTPFSGTQSIDPVDTLIGARDNGGNFVGTIDEVAFWNRTLTAAEIQTLWNGNSGLPYPFSFIASNVTLVSPEDHANTTSPITFMANASTPSGVEIVNMSLWHNVSGTFELNDTNEVSGEFNGTTFTQGIADGTYLWNVEMCNDNGNCGFGLSNFTLNIDTNAPVINISNPNGTLEYNYIGGNESLNWSVSDINLESCWFDYNGTNQTVTCADNNFTFVIEEDNLNLTIYANDSGGNVASAFTAWDYEVLEINQTFNTPVIELSTQIFTLKVDINGTISSAILFHNGTTFPANIFSLGGNLFNVTSTIQVPSFDIDQNVSFNFNLTMNSGSVISAQNQTQLVSILSVGDCISQTFVMFNLTLFDEKALTTIFGTIEADVEVLNADGITQISNQSTEFFNITNASICSNINLTEQDNRYNLELRYFSDPTNSSDFLYVPEFYHIQKGDTRNLPLEIDLFDLNVNQSTEFIIFYRDDDYISRENVLLQIERKYVDEGLFRVVEIPITSSEGSATGHFDLNNYKYRIIVTKDGEILNVFDNPAIVCESQLSGDCTLTINGKGKPNPYENAEVVSGIAFIIRLNGTDILVDYVIPSGETKEVGTSMIQSSPFTNPTLLCNQTITSSAGSFVCSLNPTIGDSQVFVEIRSNGELVKRATVYFQEDLGAMFLLNNYAIASFLIILLITMFVSSPKIMVAAATFSVALVGFLFLLNGSSIGLVLGAMSWLIIAGIIILVEINKKDET